MYTQASAAYKRFEHCLQNNMYMLLNETWQKQQIHAHTAHNTHPYTHMNMEQLMYKFYTHMMKHTNAGMNRGLNLQGEYSFSLSQAGRNSFPQLSKPVSFLQDGHFQPLTKRGDKRPGVVHKVADTAWCLNTCFDHFFL